MNMEIIRCIMINSNVSDLPTFDIEGLFEEEEFRCQLEVSLLELEDPDEESFEIEHLSGVSLDVSDPKQVQILIEALKETREFQDVLDEFKNQDEQILGE